VLLHFWVAWRHDAEWVAQMGPPLEKVWVSYNEILNSIWDMGLSLESA
jgi:hypothetical protein